MAYRWKLLICLLVAGCGAESGGPGPEGGGGSQGTAGQGGTQATAGTGGSQGVAGAGGSQGVAGQAGTQGAAGQGGTPGTGGQSGAQGIGGQGGTQGSAGRGGSQAGGGRGGTQAAAGQGGTQATAGRGGTQGVAGQGGIQGAAGRGGAAGSAMAGASGSAGASGGVMGLEAAGVRLFGRADISNQSQPRFSWSGTGFIARFSGTGLTARLSNTGPFIFKAVVDGAPRSAFTATTGAANYDLATGLTAGTHTVELYRQTEAGQGDSQLLTVTATGGALMPPPAGPGRLIEVVGDSISAGYGTLGTLSDTDCYPTESHWDTYASVAARAVGAEVSTIAASGQGMYRNYGGDMNNTLPTIYARTLMNDATPIWSFATKPQAVVINLGTNDISNGKGDPGMPFRDAYRGFVEMLRSRYPDAWIICMIGPLLSGTELTTIQGHIRAVVQARNTAGDNKIEYFGDVVAQTSDKAACQYHPNVAENLLVGNQLAGELRARLGW